MRIETRILDTRSALSAKQAPAAAVMIPSEDAGSCLVVTERVPFEPPGLSPYQPIVTPDKAWRLVQIPLFEYLVRDERESWDCGDEHLVNFGIQLGVVINNCLTACLGHKARRVIIAQGTLQAASMPYRSKILLGILIIK